MSYALEMHQSYAERDLPVEVREILLRLRRTPNTELAEQLLAIISRDPGLKRRIAARDLAMLETAKHRQDFAVSMQLDYLMTKEEEPKIEPPKAPEPVVIQPVHYDQSQLPQEVRLGMAFAELLAFLKPQQPIINVHAPVTVQPAAVNLPEIKVEPRFEVPQAPAPVVELKPEFTFSPNVNVNPARVTMPARSMKTEIQYDGQGRVIGKTERPIEG